MILALIGNQNSGKTMLFNQLTGENQHVGNFPGVTVEQAVGKIRGYKDTYVVDLPGIYSFHLYSDLDRITQDYLLERKPDVIINVVDAGNIERNLYLTLQLLELQMPMVIALNMMDELIGNGGSIDVQQLTQKLGVPVIPISAAHNDGVHELLETAVDVANKRIRPQVQDFCLEGPVHRCIHAVSHVIEDHAAQIGFPARFVATQLVDGDGMIEERLGINQNELELIEHSVLEMEHECGFDRNAALAHMRYTFLSKICQETVHKPEESKERHRSLQIDNILTHKYWGVPVFLCIMSFIFWLTFDAIGAWSNLLAEGLDWLIARCDQGMTNYGLNPVVKSLFIDGAFVGVGTVLSFLPRIIILFFFLSILEDTGYMARVAFVMDKLLRKIGLSGRSFVPMLIGFGCTVPALMATRTLSSQRDRKMTILLMPFMSCSAKIPIYAVFTSAFFASHQALVMISLYVGGMLMAILMACILNHTAFQGNPIPFVMELPNYRWPSAKSVCLLVWEKVRDFLANAFTVIFMATLVIWCLRTFDMRLNVVSNSETSLLAMLGQYFTPIFSPLGFGDWRIATALINGLMAKEAVVSSLGVLMNCPIAQLSSMLPNLFTTASAVSFMTFSLLYTPCVAAIATIRRELGSIWKTVFMVLAQCGIAWVVAFLVYHVVEWLFI